MTYAEADIDTRGRSSGEVKTTCPRCSHTRRNHRDKCLSVSLDKGTWNCHHCDWKGALNEKRERVYEPRPRKAHTRPKYQPTESEPHERAIAWFEARGIPASVVRRHHIEMRKTWMPHTEREEWALAFPFTRGGEIVNVKYRTADKNFKMESGCELVLYGIDDAAGADPLIIVEGEIDKLSVEVAGFRACVSVPNGAKTRLDDCLPSAADLFENNRRVILAGDNDEPGRQMMRALELRLGPARCWRVEWPEGCKDANDVLLKHGAADLRDRINAATPVPIEGVFTIEGIEPDMCDLYEFGIPRGMDPGWDNLADLYRPRLGETTYVTGIPGSGKSAFVSALLVNLAIAHDWQFAVFPPESLPLAQYASQLVEIYTGEPFTDGPTPRMTRQTLRDAIGWLDDYFVLLNPDDESRTLDDLLDLVRQQIYRRGLNGVVIDPWNELEIAQPPNWTETQYIGHSLMKIRQFARNYQIHIWVVAHPKKLEKDRDGKYPIPTLYDIAGSSHWYNKADNGICIYRDKSDDSKPVEVYVQKVRFKYGGRLGRADLYFDRVTGRYSEKPHFYGLPAKRAGGAQ